MNTPKIIQGGMGVNISSPRLARAVSMASKPGRETMGTISGVTLEKVMLRKLQQGGSDADLIIDVLEKFPYRQRAIKIINAYYKKPQKGIPVISVTPSNFLIWCIICANYTWVKLAKQGHSNPISINYLEKISMSHLYSIFGAMLAEVDFITMGAGIPFDIPKVILSYCEGKTATYKIPVYGSEDFEMFFNPNAFCEEGVPKLKRPGFIPIISSNVLGTMLKKRLPEGSISGFVVEEPTAGGHNAPPRNKINYGEKDVVDYSQIAELGLPFWIAGSYASPKKLKEVISLGASGIQAGSIFALSNESGMMDEIRKQIRTKGFNGKLEVRTDMKISPTGFPFKVVELENTASESEIYESRKRICDQCALVTLYQKENGSIGYRCPSEPVEDYVSKGGKIEDTYQRGCVCNGLITTAGLRLPDEDYEPPIVTLGDNVVFLRHLMKHEDDSYCASDAIKYLFDQS
jgi:nitronate monooxygenase